MYLPNTKYFLLNLEIRNRMGDLAAVSSLLAEGKFDILNGSFFRGDNGAPGFWQVYVLPLKPATTSDELGKLLTACPDVLSFEIKESKDGFLVDSLTFPIKLSSGQRAMIIRNEIWNSMLQKTREKFSSGGDVIIYDQGVTAGRVSGKDLVRELGREKISRQLDQVVAWYQSLGWGKASVLSFRPSPLNLVIRMSESAECYGQKSPKPTGHFVRGHIIGVIEEIFAIEARCIETSCLAMGNDCCQFVIDQR